MAKWSEQMNERWRKSMEGGGMELLAKLIYTDHKKGAVEKVTVFEEDLEEREQELREPVEVETVEADIPARKIKHPEKVKKVQKKCEEKREKREKGHTRSRGDGSKQKVMGWFDNGAKLENVEGHFPELTQATLETYYREWKRKNGKAKKSGGNGKKTSAAPIGPGQPGFVDSLRQFSVVDTPWAVKMTPVNPELAEKVREARRLEEGKEVGPGQQVIHCFRSGCKEKLVVSEEYAGSWLCYRHREKEECFEGIPQLSTDKRAPITRPFNALICAFNALTESEKWDAFCFVLFSLTGAMLKSQGPAISANIQELWEKLEPPMESEVAA